MASVNSFLEYSRTRSGRDSRSVSSSTPIPCPSWTWFQFIDLTRSPFQASGAGCMCHKQLIRSRLAQALTLRTSHFPPPARPLARAGSPSPDPRSHSWPCVFGNSPATVLGMASAVPDAEPRTPQMGHPNASQRPPMQGDRLAAINRRGLKFLSVASEGIKAASTDSLEPIPPTATVLPSAPSFLCPGLRTGRSSVIRKNQI